MIAEQAGSGNPHPNVRFWLLADIKLLRDLGLLSPESGLTDEQHPMLVNGGVFPIC
jgi:hypothetical protein